MIKHIKSANGDYFEVNGKRVGEIYSSSKKPFKVAQNNMLAAVEKDSQWGVIYVGPKGVKTILPFVFTNITLTTRGFRLYIGKRNCFFSFYIYKRISSLALVRRELKEQKPKMIVQLFNTFI